VLDEVEDMTIVAVLDGVEGKTTVAVLDGEVCMMTYHIFNTLTM
jgi:hypothetical protein